MAEAIFGLLGVVVGAVLTAGTEWSRDRSAKRARRQRAARLLYAELQWRRVVLEDASVDGAEPVDLDASDLLYVWREHRADLASLPWADWKQVQIAIMLASRVGASDVNLTSLRMGFELAENAMLNHAEAPM
jgi:hypothetical protein